MVCIPDQEQLQGIVPLIDVYTPTGTSTRISSAINRMSNYPSEGRGKGIDRFRRDAPPAYMVRGIESTKTKRAEGALPLVCLDELI